MTPAEAKEFLPIITAFSEGKQIQFKKTVNDPWNDAAELYFLYGPEHYRIRPKIIKYRSYIIVLGEDFMIRGRIAKEDKSLAQQEETIESLAGFIKWIDKDWVEIECPVEIKCPI